MPPLTRVMTELHRLAQPSESDAELLGRFVRQRDEAAFAALVERHGPMVLRLCRRVIGDAHAAEDAFQATFLVLARKARRLPKPSGLVRWLYGVAQRVALRARRAECRARHRTIEEEPCGAAGDPLSALTARELLVVLEEELQHLSEPHRMAVVLCCLEGHTREEAAGLLGCTVGALRGWLERGRARLHDRLLKRGITLTAALAAAEAARGSVDAALVAGAVRAALGTASATVARLACAHGIARLPLVLMAALIAGTAAAWLIPGMEPARNAALPGQPAPAQQKSAHVDALGDPLPPEAIARIGSSRLRTGGRIRGLAYSADGDSIISASDSGMVQRWDRATGKLRWSEPAKVARAAALAVDADTIHLLSDGAYQALAAASGKERRRITLDGEGDVAAVQLAPDRTSAAVASFNGPIRLMGLRTGKETRRWMLGGNNPALCFTPDGKMLAIGGDGGWIRLFDVATGEKRRELKTPLRRVTRIVIDPNGNRLLAAGLFEMPVILFDLNEGKELCRIRNEGLLDVHCAAFSRDGRQVAIGSQWTSIGVYDTADGKETHRLPSGWGACEALAFARDGKTLLAGTGDGRISQWDVRTGKAVAASASPVIGARNFLAGGAQLLLYGDNYTVVNWRTGQEVEACCPEPGYLQAWSDLSSDHTLLASPGVDGKAIDIINAKTGKTVRTLTGSKAMIRGTQFSVDGKHLYSSGIDGVVRVWETATGKQLHELRGHLPTPRMLVAPNGRWLATAANWGPRVGDYDIRLWDTATYRLVRRIAPPRGATSALAFSADSTQLAIGCRVPQTLGEGGEVAIVDVATGVTVKNFAGHTSGVTGVAFAPDGRMLATASHDRTLRLWETCSGLDRHRFEGHTDTAGGLTFSPDGRLLAAASNDAPLFIWDVYGMHGKPAAQEHWSAADKARLWEQLAGQDAKTAFQTVRRLVRQPAAAVALLRETLKPASPIDGKRLKGWISDLDSADFAARQTATAELERLGDRIDGQLKEALAQQRGLEAKRRIEALLAKCAAPTPERLARWRALEALEQIATPDAVRLVDHLAAGARGARLTREAAAARNRLARAH